MKHCAKCPFSFCSECLGNSKCIDYTLTDKDREHYRSVNFPIALEAGWVLCVDCQATDGAKMAAASALSAAQNANALAPGVKAVMHGLIKRTDLNGRQCECLTYAADKGRWLIKVVGASQEQVLLQPKNLRATVTGGAVATAGATQSQQQSQPEKRKREAENAAAQQAHEHVRDGRRAQVQARMDEEMRQLDAMQQKQVIELQTQNGWHANMIRLLAPSDCMQRVLIDICAAKRSMRC